MIGSITPGSGFSEGIFVVPPPLVEEHLESQQESSSSAGDIKEAKSASTFVEATPKTSVPPPRDRASQVSAVSAASADTLSVAKPQEIAPPDIRLRVSSLPLTSDPTSKVASLTLADAILARDSMFKDLKAQKEEIASRIKIFEDRKAELDRKGGCTAGIICVTITITSLFLGIFCVPIQTCQSACWGGALCCCCGKAGTGACICTTEGVLGGGSLGVAVGGSYACCSYGPFPENATELDSRIEKLAIYADNKHLNVALAIYKENREYWNVDFRTFLEQEACLSKMKDMLRYMNKVLRDEENERILKILRQQSSSTVP